MATKMTTSSWLVLLLLVSLAMAGDHLVQSSMGRQWHWLP
jgi:hypothetical protein